MALETYRIMIRTVNETILSRFITPVFIPSDIKLVIFFNVSGPNNVKITDNIAQPIPKIIIGIKDLL